MSAQGCGWSQHQQGWEWSQHQQGWRGSQHQQGWKGLWRSPGPAPPEEEFPPHRVLVGDHLPWHNGDGAAVSRMGAVTPLCVDSTPFPAPPHSLHHCSLGDDAGGVLQGPYGWWDPQAPWDTHTLAEGAPMGIPTTQHLYLPPWDTHSNQLLLTERPWESPDLYAMNQHRGPLVLAPSNPPGTSGSSAAAAAAAFMQLANVTYFQQHFHYSSSSSSEGSLLLLLFLLPIASHSAVGSKCPPGTTMQ